MDRLYELLGEERDFADVCRELKFYLQGVAPPVVGALQVTCADESEHECVEAFQRRFAQEMLPRLKYGSRAPMRIANPGARYEWGTVRIAEQHFATPETESAFKVLVVKINGHVSVDRSGQGVCFGQMKRYGAESCYCGAMHALLHGGDQPFVEELTETFHSEGLDRLAILRDETRIEPGLTPLLAAVVSARLHARQVVLDIQDYRQTTPTLYFVLFGVTLNKPGPDTELLGGIYTLDRRESRPRDRYRGLGDNPALYEVETGARGLRITDSGLSDIRHARNHRALARERLKVLVREAIPRNEELENIVAEVGAGKHRDASRAKTLLHSLLQVLAGLSPVTAALMLFAQGAAHIYHVHRLHRAEHARKVVESVRERVDEMHPEQAADLVDVLVRGHAEARA